MGNLVQSAPRYLVPGGSIWIVAQVYIPVGSMLTGLDSFEIVHLEASDGRFATWRATTPVDKVVNAEQEQRKKTAINAEDESGMRTAAKPKKRKKKKSS